MAHSDLAIRSAILTNKEKLPRGFLCSGKIKSGFDEGTFLFYMLEILSPWSSSGKVKKVITSVLENIFSQIVANVNEENFEKLLQEVNAALDGLVKKGEKEWLGNLNAIIGIVSDNEIYASQTGMIAGYIFRKGKISEMIDSGKNVKIPLPVNTFTDITYGQLAVDDRLVFGNTELYNHLSLDRIKKMVEDTSAKETVCELFRGFRKNKILSVNAIIIDVYDIRNVENEPILDLPEIYYIDAPNESPIKQIQKRLGPGIEISKKVLRATGKAMVLHGSRAFHYTKMKWKEKVAPASSKAFREGSHAIHEAKGSLGRLTDKNVTFKTTNHTRHSTGWWPKIQMVAETVWRLLIHLFQKQNRKYLCIVLIMIFFAIGYAKVRSNNLHRNEQRTQIEIEDAYTKAQDLYKKTKDDIALGRTTSIQGYVDALALAQKAQSSPSLNGKATALSTEIQKAIDAISKTTRIANPSPLFTLNDNVIKIVLSGLDIYGITGDGKIYIANANEKVPRLVSSISKDAGTINDLSYFDSDNEVLVSAGSKMLAYDIASKTTSELSIADSSGKWEDVQSLASYSSNIYILDSEAGTVWKHTQSSDGFSKGVSAVNTKVVSIRDAVSMAIDGNIYILQNDGSVAKFTRGANVSFNISEMPQGLDKIETPTQIVTDENVNYVFILDKKLNRIIKLNKNGQYVGQYALDGVAIDSFVVNGKIAKLWALSSGKIYEIGL